jgi:ABC-2 type transport system permease protein
MVLRMIGNTFSIFVCRNKPVSPIGKYFLNHYRHIFGKIFTVAKHEFLKTVNRKEFLFMTFIFPIFMAGIFFVPALLVSTAPAEDQKIGYIDMTNSFDFPGLYTSKGFSVGPLGEESSNLYFVEYKNSSEVMYALEEGQISSYLVVPKDFITTGVIELYTAEKGISIPRAELLSALSDTVITSLLKDKVDDPVLNRVKDPVNLKFYSIGASGKPAEKGLSEILTDLGLPFLTAFSNHIRRSQAYYPISPGLRPI